MQFSPVVGYYANRFNRVRLIAIGSITIGIASLISTLPFFIYGSETSINSDHTYLNTSFPTTTSSFDLCPSSLSCTTPEEGGGGKSFEGNTVWPAVILLFLGQFFSGIGVIVYYVIAMPLVDDLVGEQSSPLYISVMHGIKLVGQLMGYFLSAYTLTFSENPFDRSASQLDSTSVRFIGAWWLGFFISGILVLLTSIPLFFFPADFGKNVVTEDQSKAKDERSFLAKFRSFLHNPLLVLFFLGNVFRYIGINGFYAFKAKYIEAIYRTTAAEASLITGATGFAPISIGLIVGGLYISYLMPKARPLFIFVFFAELVSVVTIGSLSSSTT